MCGLTGIYSTNDKVKVEEKTLVSMRDTLVHRGPDDQGLYISPERKIGFGFRRLAIIDLTSAGNQPMSNEDGSVWLVFNGEIYNYTEIKNALIKRGHSFKSKTDSEVLLHLYEEKQEKCLEDLNGMFAFAIWDSKRQTLFAARDRVGIKPFYYYYKKFFYTSPKEELLQARIDRAKYLLTNRKLRINEVAEQSGFKNIYHFTRYFKKECGMTPSKYLMQQVIK